jgi:hypothetical protein
MVGKWHMGKEPTAIAHIDVMSQKPVSLGKLDSKEGRAIVWATVGEFAAAT